jgi:hypothetical protein
MTQGLGAPDPVPMRVGDTERNSALEALGEHLSAGRLDIEEYGERSAKVTVARTTADLTALFTDLPAPHPTLPTSAGLPAVHPATAPLAAPADGRIVKPTTDSKPVGQRVMAALVPLSAMLALVLFLTVHVPWYIFLLPAVVAIVTGAIWEDDDDRRKRELRDRRRRELGPGER